MAQLIVRNLVEELVRRLRIRAAQHGRSAEAEHREILRQALQPISDAEAFDAFLLEIPDVGSDEDFERIRETARTIEL